MSSGYKIQINNHAAMSLVRRLDRITVRWSFAEWRSLYYKIYIINTIRYMYD